MSILRRLWPRRRATDRITMGVHVVAVPKPIPLVERLPGESDLSQAGYSPGSCWYGEWDGERWSWTFHWQRGSWHTHWLPASVEVLPTRCCVPEVG